MGGWGVMSVPLKANNDDPCVFAVWAAGVVGESQG